MPDTGWKLPGTVVNNTSAGTVSWINPGNAAVANDSNAAFASSTIAPSTSRYLIATNFSFGIPSGATIKGVEYRIRRRYGSSGGPADEGVYIWDSALLSANKITRTTLPATFTERDVGGELDVWGATLTASIVNSSSFGAAYQGYFPNKFGEIYVATIWMRIHYEEDSGNFHERVSGVWRKGALSERVSGVYRSGKLYERVSGVWRS